MTGNDLGHEDLVWNLLALHSVLGQPCYELDDVLGLEGSKPVVIGSLLPMNFRVRLAGPTYQ